MEVDVVTLRRMRLAALGFTDPQPGVAAAVRRLLGVQAQDLRQAEWAIGSRVPGSVLADVWAAFDAGEVVRSWAARGTLFALAPADLRLLLALTAQRQMRTAQPRHRQLGLTDDDVDRAAEVARAELRGGGALTRPELVRSGPPPARRDRAAVAAPVQPAGAAGAPLPGAGSRVVGRRAGAGLRAARRVGPR